MTERRFRSEKYQFKILECYFDIHSKLGENIWKTEDGLYNQANQKFLELNDEAFARILVLLNEIATDHQMNVCNLLLEGNTQWDVANIIGTNQSSISKSLHGNTIYDEKGKTQYGGIGKKLIVAILKDSIMKDILLKMKEYK